MSLAALGCAIAYTLFVWWSSTGVILYLDRLPRATHARSFAAMSLVTLAALAGLARLRDAGGSLGAYGAFSCALLVWGWVEMAFLMGYVTGPRTTACTVERMGWRRARHAFEAIAWHELALLAAFAAVFAVTAGGDNRVGVRTFALLWACRQSAKLNVFLGARNLGEQLLPEHLRYLQTYFVRRAMNPLFPLSVAAIAGLIALLAAHIGAAAGDEGRQAGHALLAMLASLALLEHLFLMLPISLDPLWQWARHDRAPRRLPAPANTAEFSETFSG